MTLLLACPGKEAIPPRGSQTQNTLIFNYYGLYTTTAGSYGFNWIIQPTPGILGPVKWHLSGPGELLDNHLQPVDLNRMDLDGSGYYRPPLEVPEAGITVTVSLEAFSPFSNQYERSKEYPIKVIRQTQPMMYQPVVRDPTEIWIHAGETHRFGVNVDPRPVDFIQSLALISSDSEHSHGTAEIVPYNDNTWVINYQAPDIITAPVDVTIQATALDPWLKVPRTAIFLVHLLM